MRFCSARFLPGFFHNFATATVSFDGVGSPAAASFASVRTSGPCVFFAIAPWRRWPSGRRDPPGQTATVEGLTSRSVPWAQREDKARPGNRQLDDAHDVRFNRLLTYIPDASEAISIGTSAAKLWPSKLLCALVSSNCARGLTPSAVHDARGACAGPPDVGVPMRRRIFAPCARAKERPPRPRR